MTVDPASIPTSANPEADFFTSDYVFDLLRDNILKGQATLPRADDLGIDHLTNILNILRWKVKGWTGPWREELKERGKIGEAIQVLTENFPAKRNAYVAAVEAAQRAGLIQCSSNARADLAAFDALIAAAHTARERGLPLEFNMMIAMSSPTERWKHIAIPLQQAFHSALPGQSKEAGYRFIALVVPLITAEQPTVEAIKTAIKKNRLISRGIR